MLALPCAVTSLARLIDRLADDAEAEADVDRPTAASIANASQSSSPITAPKPTPTTTPVSTPAPALILEQFPTHGPSPTTTRLRDSTAPASDCADDPTTNRAGTGNGTGHSTGNRTTHRSTEHIALLRLRRHDCQRKCIHLLARLTQPIRADRPARSRSTDTTDRESPLRLSVPSFEPVAPDRDAADSRQASPLPHYDASGVSRAARSSVHVDLGDHGDLGVHANHSAPRPAAIPTAFDIAPACPPTAPTSIAPATTANAHPSDPIADLLKETILAIASVHGGPAALSPTDHAVLSEAIECYRQLRPNDQTTIPDDWP